MLPEHKTRREQLETSLLHSGRHRQPAASLLLSGGTLKTSPLARLPQNLSTEALQHLGVKKAQQTAEKPRRRRARSNDISGSIAALSAADLSHGWRAAAAARLRSGSGSAS